eukprot:COSAG04_NODE_1373_length_7033_cov_5.180560_2_plen_44_part_00
MSLRTFSVFEEKKQLLRAPNAALRTHYTSLNVRKGKVGGEQDH